MLKIRRTIYVVTMAQLQLSMNFDAFAPNTVSQKSYLAFSTIAAFKMFGKLTLGLSN